MDEFIGEGKIANGIYVLISVVVIAIMSENSTQSMIINTAWKLRRRNGSRRIYILPANTCNWRAENAELRFSHNRSKESPKPYDIFGWGRYENISHTSIHLCGQFLRTRFLPHVNALNP